MLWFRSWGYPGLGVEAVCEGRWGLFGSLCFWVCLGARFEVSDVGYLQVVLVFGGF